ncbi:FAD-dependent oxidoreductase [Rugamonas sp. FT107W]|uniref:FAD-dependent oxidoreductase n=1 Tax=Duganella vulcania TaxID=2692166 RepID=A0A845HJF8_9BURK|nr:D-amino acid dehydrogenase [Duganella vulcania]MYN17609.1 FAD-dependent oxidoreductase [Duganella vulcania]
MSEVIVIGGGVVGLTSAWWLAEAGYRVTLVEREAEVGSMASYRNGGQLSYRYVSPLADAGVPLKALHWLFQPDGPLRFRPEADLRQWRWLARFLANCNAAANRRTTATALQLGELSRKAMSDLSLHVPLSEFDWREAGKLVVYRSARLFEHAAGLAADAEVWTPAAIASREPALAALQGDLAGGIFNPGEAVADCHAFCLALLRRLATHPNFNGVLHRDVTSIHIKRGDVDRLDTTAGPLRADHYVLAAGIASRDLAAQAGIYLPLYPLKGYSLSAPIRAADNAPQISVTDFERKVLYARIGPQLRMAAMVDMVGADRRIDPRRIQSLVRLAREAMPGAADYGQADAWAGLRPATPSGAPIIGATRHRNLWLNVGHGPLGFTFACGSASLLAGLMRGAPFPAALAGLAPRR